MNPENPPQSGNVGEKSLRLLRPSLVVLCGPAGCGKSTFAQRYFRPTQIISSDWARARICDDERDQRFNEQAFALAHFLVEQRLQLNRLSVVDSTALTLTARRDLLDLAKKLAVPATLILFNVPLETCIERDRKRERSVGRAVVEHHYQAFEQAKATIHHEGFDQVVDLQEGDLEKVRIDILFRPIARPVPSPQRLDGGVPRRFERPTQDPRFRSKRPADTGRSVASAAVKPAARPAAAPPGVATPAPAVREKTAALPQTDESPKTAPANPPEVR